MIIFNLHWIRSVDTQPLSAGGDKLKALYCMLFYRPTWFEYFIRMLVNSLFHQENARVGKPLLWNIFSSATNWVIVDGQPSQPGNVTEAWLVIPPATTLDWPTVPIPARGWPTAGCALSCSPSSTGRCWPPTPAGLAEREKTDSSQVGEERLQDRNLETDRLGRKSYSLSPHLTQSGKNTKVFWWIFCSFNTIVRAPDWSFEVFIIMK